MGKKRLRSVLRTTVSVVMCISLLFPAVPLWAASEDMEQNAVETQDSATPNTLGQYDSIPGLSGELLYDTAGQKVMANGGEIHQVEEGGETKWYWFGESINNISPGSTDTMRNLHLYSSTDLYNWTREEDIFRGMTSREQFDTDEYFKNLYGSLSETEKDTVFECLQNCPTAHPRVLYNEKSHQYVMWVPVSLGKQCIATSSSIKGPFKFVKYCESVQGFTGMYKESDGKAYIVYRNQSGTGICMSKLTDDYMDVEDTARNVNFSGGTINSPEVGMFQRKGKYYMVHAAEKRYAVADSLTGTWSVHTLQMYNNENQSFEDVTDNLNPTHQILQVNTENGVVYINITDCWSTQNNSNHECYVWLPLKFSEDGAIALRKLSNWKLGDIDSEEAEEPEPAEPKTYDSIPGLSGEILYDTEGWEEVKANFGEIHQAEENGKTKWYWFGEDVPNNSSPGASSTVRGIHLYSSTDLYNWTREEDILRGMTSKEQFGTDEYFRNLYGDLSESEKDAVFECLNVSLISHPKMFYNEKKHQYVMWVDSNGKQCIATSSSIKGPFKIENYCESVGPFITTYKESNGTAYILHQNQSGNGLSLSRLTDDYMDVTGMAQTINFSASGMPSGPQVGVISNPQVGMFKRGGKYYMVDAGSKQYAVADSLGGTWSVHTLQLYNEEEGALEDISDSWSPTHQILQVNTGSGVIYINTTVSWNAQGNMNPQIRYIWLPIKFFEDGTIALRKLSNWKLEDIEAEEPEEPEEPGNYDSIPGLSGEILYDTVGQEVKANGGEIHQVEENGKTKWYWFGESINNISPGSTDTMRNLHLYSSTDLYNWTREEDIFRGMTSRDQFKTDDYFKNLYGSLSESEKDTVFECLQNCPTAHPRVLYNEKNHQYVMWVPFLNGKQCIATSSNIKGPFKFVKYCESVQGFTGMYKESDGRAYILYRNQSGTGICMSKLTDDYMDVAGTARTINFSGGALNSPEVGMFKRGGKYYMVHAAEKRYAVADSLTGTWSVHTLQMYNDQTFENISDTWSPTHQILQVSTESGVIYINITERWFMQNNINQECYVWLPLKFSEGGAIALRKLSNWKLEDIDPEEAEEPEEPESYDSIPGLSGEVLYDTERWEEVKANFGEIHQIEENGGTKWYWFGEDVPNNSSSGASSTVRGIHLYSSTDLYNWTREEDILRGMTSKEQFETDEYFRNLYGDLSESEKDAVFECLNVSLISHPKMFYNEKKHQYVMWVDSNGKQCIATSSSIKGPFKIENYCESVGTFITTYKESDGTAYILHQNQSGNGLSLSRLTDDYMDVTGMAQTIKFSASGMPSGPQVGVISNPQVGMFKRGGKYYMVDAGIKQYAVADSLGGTWSVHTLQMYDEEKKAFEDISDSWSPTHQILQVNTGSGVIYINTTVSWNAQGNMGPQIRHVWLPIKFFEDGTIALRKLSNWKLEDIEAEEPEEPEQPEEPENYDSIPGLSGEILYDTEGQEVKANGGEIHQVEENGKTKWYWFGESINNISPGSTDTMRNLHLYSSTDLYNWTREEDIFRGMTSRDQFVTDNYFKNLYGSLSDSEKDTVFECLKDCPTAHPRVLYNENSHQYVMWVPFLNGKQCIATSSSIKGPFKFVKYCESVQGFTGMYKESDGRAYILYRNQSGTSICMSKLTDDYMDVAGTARTINFSGGALNSPEVGMFKRGGKYYMVHAAEKRYAVADSLTGTWSVHTLQMYNDQTFENISDTWSPTHQILQVSTESGVIYINITERWFMQNNINQECYIWLPLKFSEDGTIALRKLSNWKLEDIEAEEPDEENPPVVPPTVEVTEVRLTETSKTLKVGDKYRIEATILPANATNKNLSYGSSDESVASVSDAGEVEAKKAGTVTVTVTSANGKKAELRVTVEAVENPGEENPPVENPPVKVTEVKLTETIKTLKVGDKYRIEATVLPENADNKTLSYRSSNESVASVSDAGEVEAKKAGTATVAVTSVNGKTAQLKVTVEAVENPGEENPPVVNPPVEKDPVEVAEVKLTETSKTLKVGDKYQIKATVLPENADNKTLSYRSSDESVASVSNAGQVEAKKAGTATVAVTSANGKTAQLKVTVEAVENPGEENPPVEKDPVEVTEVKLTETSKTLKVGDKYQIEATVLPENADNKTLSYKSSDKSVASVSDTGEVEAKKVGTATVTVTSANGKTAELKVTVAAAPDKKIDVEKVLVSTDKIIVGVGEKVQLDAAVYPKNASDKKLTYKPSNDKVKVSKAGIITAQKTGTCRITITSTNNKKTVVQVTVKKKPGKISLNSKKKTLKVGKSFQIKPKLANGTASYKITYTSNKKSVATVSQDGKVTAKKKGDAVITVKTYNGKKASLKIHVK